MHTRIVILFSLLLLTAAIQVFPSGTCLTPFVEIDTPSWDYAPTIAHTSYSCWGCFDDKEHIYWSGQDTSNQEAVIYGRIRDGLDVVFQDIVLRPNGINCDIADPTAIRINGLWYMYFTGAPSSPCNGLNNKIFGATSSNGRTWSYLNSGQPLLDFGFSSVYGVGQPSAVLLNSGVVRLYYTHFDGPYGGGTYVAESSDGVNFTRLDLGRRVFEGGKPGWSPVVGKYYSAFRAAFTHGNNKHYLASSNDGLDWVISSQTICGANDLDAFERWEDGSIRNYYTYLNGGWTLTFRYWWDNGAPPEQNPNLSNWKMFADMLEHSLFP